MHVLYLIDSLIAGGGAERSLALLAPHYRSLGIDLDVAYLYEREGVRAEIEAAGAGVFALTGGAGMAGEIARLARLVRDRRPDLVHTTLFEADVAGRLAALGTRIPLVTSLVNAAYGPEQLANPNVKRWKLRAAQLLDVATARRVARFHAVSSSVADAMAARLRVPRDRIDVIPRGRNADALGRRTDARRAAARAALGVADDEVVVLAVGRHEYQKGYDMLLDAFARARCELGAARLLIAGRLTTLTPALQRAAADLRVDTAVEFLGIRDDVPDLLCAADVFAFSSRWEGMPGGVIEAMALEVPIVATDIDPVVEVLGEARRPELVPVDDSAAFACALVAAARGHAGGGEQVATARRRFEEHFTIDVVAREMLRFYERSLGR